jgi:hypothetical protein
MECPTIDREDPSYCPHCGAGHGDWAPDFEAECACATGHPGWCCGACERRAVEVEERGKKAGVEEERDTLANTRVELWRGVTRLKADFSAAESRLHALREENRAHRGLLERAAKKFDSMSKAWDTRLWSDAQQLLAEIRSALAAPPTEDR